MLIVSARVVPVCLALIMVCPAAAGRSPEADSQGKTLYRQYCIRCHGSDSHLFAKLDELLFAQSVYNGKGLMPGFGTKLTPEDMQVLWSYITYIQNRPSQ